MESIRDVEKRATLGQRGFTLIEIIAVLVILGILSAVAVPQYLDLQTESRIRGVQGALAAGSSQISLNYANHLLNGTGAWSYSATETLGDFSITMEGACGVNGATVTVSDDESPDWVADVAEADKTKSFTVCQ